MAKQVINIGAIANDGTGDQLRTSVAKVNTNFTEVYNNITTLSGGNMVAKADLTYAQAIANNVTTLTNTVQNLDIPTATSQLNNDSGFLTLQNVPSIPQDIADLTDNSNLLGGGGSGPASSLIKDGATNSALQALEQDVSDKLIIFDQFVTDNSMEAGYPWGLTLPLNLSQAGLYYSSLQYWNSTPIPPAVVSAAHALYTSYSDWRLAVVSATISSGERVWHFDNEGNITLPVAGRILNADNTDYKRTIIGNFKFDGSYLGTIAPNDGWGESTLTIDPNGEGWGGLTLPNVAYAQSGMPTTLYGYGDGGVNIATNRGTIKMGPAGEIGAPTHFHIAFENSNENAPYSDLYLGDDFNYVRIRGSYNIGHGVEIGANDRNGGNTSVWVFGADGTITFPDGSIQNQSGSMGVLGSVDLHNGGTQQARILSIGEAGVQAVITGPLPAQAGNNVDRLIIQGRRGAGQGEGGDVYLWAGDADINGGDIKIYAGDADDPTTGYGGYINIDAGNGYNQGGHLGFSAGNSSEYGGNITISSGYGGIQGGNINISTPGGTLTLQHDGVFNIPSNVNVNGNLSLPAGVSFGLDGSNNAQITTLANDNVTQLSYKFGRDGSITFPDGSIQKKAFTGRIVDVPTHSSGTPGDLAGDISFDTSHMYYCTADYAGSIYTAYCESDNGGAGNDTTLRIRYVGAPFNFNTFLNPTAPDLTGYIVTGPGVTGTVTISGTPTQISGDTWTYPLSGTFSQQAGGNYQLAAPSNIWKRVAWSNDTW